MVKNFFLVLFGILLLATNLVFAESIIFMHHSVGADLIQYGGLRSGLNSAGHQFYDHDYNWIGLTLADGSSAGMNFDVPGDNTDPDGYSTIFSQSVHATPDNTFSYMMQYDVIIFKSCFYASRILSDAQLDNYHTYYLSIRAVADAHPEKLFVIVTPPPNSPTDSDTGGAPAANRARAFANWLKSDEYLAGHPNIVVFDLFDQLADGSNYLRPAYRSGDSHPNVLADETVGPIFVSFVDTAIDNFDPGTSTPTCSDTDGGRTYTILGTTSNSSGTSQTDSCLADGRLQEFYCSATSVVSETISCSAGYECIVGRCVESTPTQSCSDSDGGRTYTILGTTSNSSGTSQTDSCLADGRLQEYFCSNTSVISETVSCLVDQECNTRRCVESTPEPEPSGSSVFIDFETTEYSWDRWDGSAATMACSRTTSAYHNGSWSLDLNYNVRSGQEATCGTSFDGPRDLSNGSGLSFWYMSGTAGLPLKVAVFSGNPGDPTPFEVTFVSSVESTTGWVQASFMWSEFEKAPWAWQPETEVNTARVTGIAFSVDSVSSSVWRVDDVGLSGTAPEHEPLVCDDPDGKNYSIQSTANDSLGASGTDVCLADGRLQEYYCSAENIVTSELISCPARTECVAGACTPIIPVCEDTDMGVEYEIQGSASDTFGVFGTDVCLADGRLQEYYCSVGEVNSEVVSCAADQECNAGRCVDLPPEPEELSELLIWDFEPIVFENHEEGTSKFQCVRSSYLNHSGQISMRIFYLVRPGNEVSCSESFYPLKLTSGSGISFWLNSTEIENVNFVLYSDNSESSVAFEAPFVTSGSGVWEQYSFGWDNFTSSDGNATTLDTSNVVGFGFSMRGQDSGKRRGYLWIDDITLLDESESLLFNFENMVWTWNEIGTSKFRCYRYGKMNHTGTVSLRTNYNVRYGDEVSCDYPTYQLNLDNSNGISFYVNSSGSANVNLLAYAGETVYYTTFETSGSNIWDQVNVSWDDFSSVSGGLLNPEDITKFGFGMNGPVTGRTRGIFWVDDVSALFGESSEPEPLVCDDVDGRNYSFRSTANDSLGTSGTDVCLADGRLQEYYCSAENIVTSEVVFCSIGQECVLGACVEIPPELSEFCPTYENSTLYRPRASQVILNPSSSSEDFSWLLTISSGPSNVEYVLNPGTYSFPSTNDVLWSDFVIGDDITIRGATGNADDVVLAGQGYEEYCEGFIVAGANVVISDLAMKDIRHHAISIKPDMGADAPYIYNVHLYDIGNQAVKLPLGGVSDGVIACSRMGFSSEDAVAGDYIGAMSLHAATDWTIRDNIFYNYVGEGTGCEVDVDCGSYTSGPAVTVWSDSYNTVIERNQFINNYRNLALDLGRGHHGGIVRNNLIYRDGSFNPGAGVGDAGIELWTVDNLVVAHNTLYAPDDYPGLIEVMASSNVTISNNLMSTSVWDRGGNSGINVFDNIEDLELGDFIVPGDVHIYERARFVGVCSLQSDVINDIDGESRDYCVVGADHPNNSSSSPEPIPPSSTELIQPADIEYLGAFKLPGSSGGSDWTWGGGSAATFYPDGDPGGAADGFSGSLYAVGHDHQQMISEISIPVPVNSRNLDDLNTATTLQPFTNVRGSSFPAIPDFGYPAIEYLPAQGVQTSGKLHLAWGFHLFSGINTNTHSWIDLNLSSSSTPSAWRINGYTPYMTADYMFAIPELWATENTPGMLLATGRFREGEWSGRGPTLFAYGPWNAGNPPAGGSTVDATPLLLYGIQDPGGLETRNSDSMQIDDFCVADEWSGGAWLTAGNKSAVMFVGTHGLGDCWYGFSDGTVWPYEGPYPPEPPAPHNQRGYWAENITAQMILYNPVDLAAVANGSMETYEPQPYATINLDDYLYDSGYNYATEKRHLVGAAAFDREHGLLYVFEKRVDTLEEQSVVHVFRVN